ncbi:MAG: hypothetical protein ACREU3_01265 [Steroidobacteraceae bacterium]
MADRHSTRRSRAHSTVRSIETHFRPKSPGLITGRAMPVPFAPDVCLELVNELKSVAWRLTAAYSTCITVQAALEGQMADQDGEFAGCLRSGVSDPVSRQVERLHALVSRLGGTTSDSQLG